MKNLKRISKFNFILIAIILMAISACVPSTNSSNTRSTSESNDSSSTEFDDPTYSNSLAFIEVAGQTFSSLYSVPSEFTGTLRVKGQQIHSFLKNEDNQSLNVCLLARFENSVDNQLALFALIPTKRIDPANNTLEHYYLLQSSEETSNLNTCSGFNLLTNLSTSFPGETRAYLFSTVCPNCSTSLTSNGIEIYDSNGTALTNLQTSFLRLQIASTSTGGGNNNPSCSLDSNCTALGAQYDCCLEGQCVKDLTVRSDVDQSSSDFLESVLQIQINPANVYNYPEFYYLCPNGSPNDDGDTDITPVDRMVELERLYNCTEPQNNEEGLCTVTYDAAFDQIENGISFSTLSDDTDFSDIWSGSANITDIEAFSTRGGIAEIKYADQVVYNESHYSCMRAGSECALDNGQCTSDATLCPINKTATSCKFDPLTPGNFTSNSNLSDAQCVVIKPGFLTRDNLNDRLEITYRINASCEKINSQLARCEKFYIQGETDTDVLNQKVSDHAPASQDFNLPSYADTSRQVLVYLDGLQQLQNTDWTISGNVVTFSETVFDGQEVRLEYFVQTGVNPVLVSRSAAIERINEICGCDQAVECGLTAIEQEVGGSTVIADYKCDYPNPPTQDPPIEQIKFLSSAAIPVRYFDEFGATLDEIDANSEAQEGTRFEYTNNNNFTPNNVSTYIGFHEIHGSISTATSDAKPPLQVDVKKNRFYNIFVNQGSYSSCSTCGTDYYSALNRVFPNAFDDAGGGYTPDPTKTSKRTASGFTFNYRSDDLLFGRACFVPASMIPWSHRVDSDVQNQRRDRQAAQHALFANGYQRDWYGFDYGSVIGSFDGVKWFAIGQERQIRADTNKMYLAVNAYFGDRALNSGFTIRINEVVTDNPGLLIAKTDFASSGAQCQQFHTCDTDQECVSQLGWDYVCAEVNQIRTDWPQFDDNGNEKADSAFTTTIRNLVGTGSGPSKRCVYRGRGALCHPDYASRTNNNGANPSYAGTADERVNGCTQNYYCADLGSSAFNNRISRYAASPVAQNASSDVPSSEEDSTFGLGARVIGRPYQYTGNEVLNTNARRQLQTLNGDNLMSVEAMCLPGRDIETTNISFEDQHALGPAAGDETDTGDQVNAIGMTKNTDQDNAFYNSCPTFDSSGNLLAFESPSTLVEDLTITTEAAAQNLSTRSLDTFSDTSITALTSPFDNVVDTITLQENRCMRAPGSACFSDFDCGPNSLVRSVLQSFDETDSIGLNEYETFFWQEELICSQEIRKDDRENYDPKNNRCCRDTDLTYTIATQDFNSNINTINTTDIAGVTSTSGSINGVALSDSTRISQNAVTLFDRNGDPTTYPSLVVNDNDACPATGCGSEQTTRQFNTFSLAAERSCCSGHWVREFHEDNGGGNDWGPEKFQSIDKRSFACLNYVEQTTFSAPATGPANDAADCLDPTNLDCDCTDPANISSGLCPLYQTPLVEGHEITKFFSSLELTGIPQVLIKSSQRAAGISAEHLCKIDDTNPTTTAITGGVIPNTITTDEPESEDSANIGDLYFKGSDADNFEGNIKQVFSADKIRCCTPAGDSINASQPESACCTGNANGNRCCLPDFTNVTVYFNRYVSSALKDLPNNRFDEFTGRPISATEVVNFANENSVCCSGRAAIAGSSVLPVGVLGSDLFLPTATGFQGQSNLVQRFISGSGPEDQGANNNAMFYDLGVKWNQDVYCIPQ